MPYEQGAATWVTVKVSPAMVMEPLRSECTALASADHDTLPSPLPLDPAVTCSQPVSLEIAVQAQAVVAVTLTDPLPPL